MFLNSLKLPVKLGIIVAFMAIPTVILAWLFFQNANKAIDETIREQAGMEDTLKVWQAMTSTTQAATNGSAPSAFLAQQPDLATLAGSYEARFGVADKQRAFRNALDRIGWPAKPLARGTDVSQVVNAGRELITVIGDGTGLSTDPELDTYYLIKAMTTDQAELVDHAGRLFHAATEVQAQKTVSAPALAELLVELAHVGDSAQAAKSALQNAVASTSDARLKQALDGARATFSTAGDAFAATAQALTDALKANVGQAQSDDFSKFYTARAQLTAANRALWQDEQVQLATLLSARISGLKASIYQTFGVAGAILVVALAAAVFIARQTAKGLTRAIETMTRLTRNDFDADIVGMERKDEMGEIARSLEVFKENGRQVAELSANYRGQVDAIRKSQAVIEFDLTGKVLDANDVFCDALGYSVDEIKGQHHSMFVDPAVRQTTDYRIFWEKLGRGEFDAGQYKRIGRGGKEIWIQASYNPILDLQGKPFKVVKYATDITAQKLQTADFEGQLAAISKAQAVIEFDLSGKVLFANENFLAALGYTLSEIKGQHHSMFVDPTERQGAEYRLFWEKLGRGEFDAGQYKRIGRGGKEVWIQASYNPIMDMNGKPFKVVKYAADVTEQVKAARIMQQAVQETQAVVAAAKENDLTLRIPMDGKSGDIADLCMGVNGLLDTMTAVIADILGTSSTITSAVSEITSGTNDLSQRTEKQASNLEETSSSMEEIATTIRQNADNAQQANQLAINARGVATEGGQVVARAVDAMSKIESSSRKISDIIGVIDEIAFQTNLLALNAAVEAARAGDAGRGFAVVAAEVRSLAQRSSEAAKDIKALIVESGGQVKDGVQLVNNAGASLNEIVDSVKRVTDIVSEIAAASKEQAIGVEEINHAVSQMDEMTQQNSALVEENAAACRMLQQQAEDMHHRMSSFTVSDTGTGARVEPIRRSEPTSAPQTKSAPRQQVRKVARAGGAQRLQADLAASFDNDRDWKEF